ncbi:MAG: DUF1810 domain-containing protein [Lactimicrobium sp.]|jgi:uncharacterized protein (DUF1810 family)|uniref:DUF1810 domain-containing protein n=1 Tax=Lactimicrobium sp. TaxID=2563780 RepID=UPI002F354D15
MENNLKRFYDAQMNAYDQAFSEIKSGRKRSHWMWYIFPQIHDLGHSSISRYYAISSLQEAQSYLQDDILGPRLEKISAALLELKTNDPDKVFGSPDDLKLCSCMTLFEQADPDKKVFSKVLEKFYGGRRDEKTLAVLAHDASIRNTSR